MLFGTLRDLLVPCKLRQLAIQRDSDLTKTPPDWTNFGIPGDLHCPAPL